MQYGIGNFKWSTLAERLPGRIGKQCRERWFNHLGNNIKFILFIYIHIYHIILYYIWYVI